MKNSIMKDILTSIRDTSPKTQPYDTTAEVVRVDGDTLWVHIPGGIDETPVRKSINANIGDTVNVRVSGGSAWLTGNTTAPPTDDTTAKAAKAAAETAKAEAEEASDTADYAQRRATSALKIAGDTAQHFWVTEEGSDTGAHITEVTQEEFEADPTTAGGNLLARSNGIAVRDGMDELAVFSADGIRIGKSSGAHTEIDSYGMRNLNNSGIPFFDIKMDGAQTAMLVTRDGDFVSDTLTADYYPYTVKEIDMPISPVSGSIKLFFNSGYKYSSSAPYTNVFSTFTFTYGTAASPTVLLSGITAQLAYDGNKHLKISATTSQYSAYYRLYRIEDTESAPAPAYALGLRQGDAGAFSSILGENLVAEYADQTAIGKYNDNQSGNAFEIGNGTADNVRSNALTVDWSGNVDAAGDITDGNGNVLSNKVDKVTGKGLSTNDYTTTEKNKLAGIEAGAEANPTISSGTGTVNSNITVSRATCRLLKIGNVVFITAGIGNKTSATTTSTNLFTIPTGYRPSSEVTIQGYVDSAEANFTISTSGQVKQTLASSWTNCFTSGFYTI